MPSKTLNLYITELHKVYFHRGLEVSLGKSKKNTFFECLQIKCTYFRYIIERITTASLIYLSAGVLTDRNQYLVGEDTNQ
jgi:hypothetical protein